MGASKQSITKRVLEKGLFLLYNITRTRRARDVIVTFQIDTLIIRVQFPSGPQRSSQMRRFLFLKNSPHLCKLFYLLLPSSAQDSIKLNITRIELRRYKERTTPNPQDTGCLGLGWGGIAPRWVVDLAVREGLVIGSREVLPSPLFLAGFRAADLFLSDGDVERFPHQALHTPTRSLLHHDLVYLVWCRVGFSRML